VEQEYGYDHEGIHYGEFEIGEKDYAGMQVDGTTFLFTFGPVKHYKRPKALVPLFFLLLMAYVLYLATRKLFAPILQIQSGVKRIGTGELDYRLDVRRNDELGLLANDINDMAAELQKMLDAKRQLLLAVSHELRSPLTRANVAVELLENNHLKDQIKDDIQEMEKLINDILETERFSSHHNHLERAEQNINILCLEVIDTYFPQDSIQINLPEPEAIAFVDKSLFTLLLKNLIANAVKYQNKQTTLTVELVDGFLQIVVCDDGNGVEAKHLPHLTEPFYRVDPARQRQTGGYGLGLYLCRVISQAHDGEIHITSNLGEGTCVTARLLISGQFKKAE
jgi:signal transduction histidine kinase